MDQIQLEQNFQELFHQAQSDGRFLPSRANWRVVLDEDGRHQGWDQIYVYHTGWAARILAATRPAKHVDIGSSVYFAGIASAIVPMDFYEFRRTPIDGLSGLNCGDADITKLPFANGSIQSLSAMHMLEHIGLGRYGDPIDACGDRKGAAELCRVLAPGGQLLFVAPVGQPRIMYNAHRIYSYQMVLDLFFGLHIKEFTMFSPRTGYLIPNANPELVVLEDHECGAGGQFWFTK